MTGNSMSSMSQMAFFTAGVPPRIGPRAERARAARLDCPASGCARSGGDDGQDLLADPPDAAQHVLL
jgi:hypothetical protein